MIVQSLSVYWASLSRLSKRLLVVSVLIFDSCLGLLFKLGLLNFVDFVLLDSLPSDFVWLLQTLQLISMGFGLVKIVFDDLKNNVILSVILAYMASEDNERASREKRVIQTRINPFTGRSMGGWPQTRKPNRDGTSSK